MSQQQDSQPTGAEHDPCLVCQTCGEAFDNLASADEHQSSNRPDAEGEYHNSFRIELREDAF
jgi:hypothetical protein